MLFITFAAFTAAFTEHVVRCPISHQEQVAYVERAEVFDIWSIQPESLDVRIRTPRQGKFIRRLFKDQCESLFEDLDALAGPLFDGRRVRFEPNAFFSDFQSYDNIVNLLKKWTADFPDLITFNASIGKSYEGRDIPAIVIKKASSTPKKAVWWNSGQHAREWIGPSTLLYVVDKLLASDKLSGWLDNLDIHVTPMMNPDGYEYSRTKDRFWRKNRRRNKDGSYGVDLNRNWDEHWCKVGASTRPSTETYCGTAAFSEPETKAISDYVLSIPNRYAGIDFHSYGQYVLRNWGWISDDSKNEPILKELGDGISAAIWKQSGKKYSSIKGADMYAASGATDDWMTAKAGMIGFTIELRDTGRYGFNAPASEIPRTGDEIWASMNYFLDFIASHKDIQPNEYI